tara:strand:+ start:2269 stop:4365 length:2097 start_codon:yes stop_codon:yes gene_type:complete
MANNNIKLPNGETVSVPEWASERTLKTLLSQLKVGSRFYKSLTDLIAKGDFDAKKLQQAIEKNTKKQQQSDDKENKAERKSRENFAKTIAKRTNDIVGAFSNTDKPLSSLTDNLHQLTKGIGTGVSGLIQGNAALSKLSKGFMKGGKFIEGGADAFFAYAGFQAGRVEQFAAAQENMINAGAIFHEAGFKFDSLYQRASESGITYKKFTEIVSQHGVGLQVLGKGVSSGAVNFNKFFKQINLAGDQFGDWGLSSETMAETYAQYIDVARLTGTLQQGMAGVLGKSKIGFTELMNETSALASLTGMSRDKIIRDRFAAKSDPKLAMGIDALVDANLPDQAAAAHAIVEQGALLKDVGGQELGAIMDGITITLQQANGDLSKIDVRSAMIALGHDQHAAALDAMDSTFIASITNALRTGKVDGNMDTFMIEKLSQLTSTIDSSYGILTEGPAAIQYEYEKLGIIINRDYGNILDGKLPEAKRTIGANLDKAGQGVEALNNMTATYLTAMAWLTWELDDATDMAEGLSSALLSFVTGDERVAGEPDPTEFSGPLTAAEEVEKIGGTAITAQQIVDNPAINDRYSTWLEGHPNATDKDKLTYAAAVAHIMNMEKSVMSSLKQTDNQNEVVEPIVPVAAAPITYEEIAEERAAALAATTNGMSAVEIMAQQSANYAAATKNMGRVILKGYGVPGAGYDIQGIQ